jgi:hypothetical protein
VRHTQIRNHDGKRSIPPLRGGELVNRCLSSVRGKHFITIALERLAKRSNDQRVVIHNQNAQLRRNAQRRLGQTEITDYPDGNGKAQSHDGTLARRAFDFKVRTMPLDHSMARPRKSGPSSLSTSTFPIPSAAPAERALASFDVFST